MVEDRSSVVLAVARIAWLARAYVHLAVGFVALWALRTRPAGGAIVALLAQPWGSALLCSASVAAALWALWRVFDAFRPSAHERTGTLGRLASAVVYLLVAVWLGDLVVGGALLEWSGLDGVLAASRSGRAAMGYVLRTRAGPVVVLVLGILMVTLGMAQIGVAEVRRWGDLQLVPALTPVVDTLGVLGFVGRGMVLVGVGLAVGFAAILALPGTAGEADLVLEFLRRPAVGLSAYGLVAAAFAAFGLFALVEALGSRAIH